MNSEVGYHLLKITHSSHKIWEVYIWLPKLFTPTSEMNGALDNVPEIKKKTCSNMKL